MCVTRAIHYLSYCILNMGEKQLEHIQKEPAGDEPAGTLLIRRALKCGCIMCTVCSVLTLGLMPHVFYIAKVLNEHCRNCICMACRSCREVQILKVLAQFNLISTSNLLYSTNCCKSDQENALTMENGVRQALLKVLPCRRQLQANEERHAPCHPGGWGLCLENQYDQIL